LGNEADFYVLLGIGREAGESEVREAYGRAIHRFRERLGESEPPAPEELDGLRQAYRILLDPASRQAYDQRLATAATARPQAVNAPPIVDESSADSPFFASEWRFRFSGDGGEYFRIWIVNLLLSIVTLGIYSAWAKVRREQYFHRHLWLEESAFDYHGQPQAILKGRFIALGLLGIVSIAQRISPAAYGLTLLCLLPAVPWLAIRALRFRAFNTSYRGLRFSFHGTYGEAFRVFVLYGLLAMFTLWIAFPVWYRRLRQFIFSNLRFGGGEFDCTVGVGQIYGAVLVPALLTIGALFLSGIFLGSIGRGGPMRGGAIFGMIFIILPVIFIGFQAVIVPWIGGRLINAVWGSVRLEQNHFRSSLLAGRYIALTLGNWLLIIVTLGLYFPWARVRMARYRAEALSIEATGDLDAFVAGECQTAAAIGDETAEMFDLDIGL